MKNNENGFSLIELVVAAAIIAMLTATAMPYLMNAKSDIEEKIEQYEMTQQYNQEAIQNLLEEIN